MSKETGLNKWVCFPSGRWCTTVSLKRGYACLHAWTDGSWAISRTGPGLKDAVSSLVSNSEWHDEGKGFDLKSAMNKAERVALEIAKELEPQ